MKRALSLLIIGCFFSNTLILKGSLAQSGAYSSWDQDKNSTAFSQSSIRKRQNRQDEEIARMGARLSDSLDQTLRDTDPQDLPDPIKEMNPKGQLAKPLEEEPLSNDELYATENFDVFEWEDPVTQEIFHSLLINNYQGPNRVFYHGNRDIGVYAHVFGGDFLIRVYKSKFNPNHGFISLYDSTVNDPNMTHFIFHLFFEINTNDTPDSHNDNTFAHTSYAAQEFTPENANPKDVLFGHRTRNPWTRETIEDTGSKNDGRDAETDATELKNSHVQITKRDEGLRTRDFLNDHLSGLNSSRTNIRNSRDYLSRFSAMSEVIINGPSAITSAIGRILAGIFMRISMTPPQQNKGSVGIQTVGMKISQNILNLIERLSKLTGLDLGFLSKIFEMLNGAQSKAYQEFLSGLWDYYGPIYAMLESLQEIDGSLSIQLPPLPSEDTESFSPEIMVQLMNKIDLQLQNVLARQSDIRVNLKVQAAIAALGHEQKRLYQEVVLTLLQTYEKNRKESLSIFLNKLNELKDAIRTKKEDVSTSQNDDFVLMVIDLNTEGAK